MRGVLAVVAAALAACGSGAPGPAVPPGPPLGVVASPDVRSARVSWSAPAAAGSSTITRYTVTATPDGVTAGASGLAATVSGLRDGTSYTFTVTATSASGTGPSSAPSAPVTTPSPPDAPSSVVAAPADGSASLTWSAPPGDGGAPLTGYTVLVSPPAPAAIFAVSGTAATVTGLANGTAYTFRVHASNAVGDGAPSPDSAPVTPFGLPGAPTGVAAQAGNGQAMVSWTEPPSNGSAITSYLVTASPGGLRVASPASGATVGGLANGVPYSFTVAAVNAAGVGAASAPSTPVTPVAPPPVLIALALSPSPLTVPRAAQQQLQATGSFDVGPSHDVTALVQWTTTDAAVAAVSGAGLVSGVAVGGATITAGLDGVSRSVAVTVTPAVTALAVVPAAVSLPLGRTLQLAAVATLEDGTSSVVTSAATWTSTAPEVMTVAGGRLTPAAGAAAAGASAIAAGYGGKAGAATATLAASASPIGPGHDGDPFLAQQWHLQNTGQTAFATNPGIAGNDIAAAATYQAGFAGHGVKVAVVDTGLEIAHEDLAANVVPGSWNFSTGTSDPTSTATTGDHGTSVAGLVAAARGNGLGGMGVAPSAGLNGYNLLAGTQTVASFVASLGGGNGTGGPRSGDVWIFNQSFGTQTTAPFLPDPTVAAQYLDGVTSLRGGLGAIYVKSAGNGFQGYGDGTTVAPDCSAANAAGLTCQNASMDPANTLPMNVVVGALNAAGTRSSYATAGSALWVSAPGGEYGLSGGLTCGGPPCPAPYFEPAMITTDQSGCGAGYARGGVVGSAFDTGSFGNGSCSYLNTFNGTSAAAPVTSGVIALLLEANPSLTWRDVKGVLAASARRVDPSRAPVTVALSDGAYPAEPGWTVNAAGHAFHDWYGFGAVDADAALAIAQGWAPGQLGRFQDTGWITGRVPANNAIPDDSVAGATASATVPPAKDLVIEAVQVQVSTDHPWLGDLGVELVSPAGTRSVLLNVRNGFGASSGTATLQLASNAFLDERAGGAWTLKVVDGWATATGHLLGWQLRIYGH